MKKILIAAVCAALFSAPVAFAQDSTSAGNMKGHKMNKGKMQQGMTKKTTVTKKTVKKTS